MANEDFQKILLEKLTSFEENQARMEDKLLANLSRIEAKVDKILEDQPQDIMAILNVINDKVSTKDDIARIEDILDVLAARSTRQEADILGLKRAK